MIANIRNLAILGLVGATMIVAGCASPKPKSHIVVAPLATPAHQSGYTGGALVDNSQAIQNAAQSLQSVVHFDFNSDAIKPEAAAILDKQVAFLVSNPTARVQVAGHTDERGTREYNMSLGERRAAAVRAYLASKGVNGANVEILSFGEEQPVATGSNEASWAQNRRAELSY